MQQLLACDIGFGSCKVVHAKGVFKFPSAIAFKKSSQEDLFNEDIYHYDGIDYLVGDHAVCDALTTRDYSFLEKYAPLLLYKAIVNTKLKIKNEIHLTTGLSLLNWNKKEQFASKIVDFIVNKSHICNIQVNIIPQGKGIYLDMVESRPDLKEQLLLVVDIGYNTLDVIPFDNNKVLSQEAWATSQGISLIVDEVRKSVDKSYGMTINETRANNIMQKKCISIDGEVCDLSIMINSEKFKYKEIVLNELCTRNSDLFKSCDKIIIAGGGAYLLDDLDFGSNILFADKPYEFSNVNGYWKALRGS